MSCFSDGDPFEFGSGYSFDLVGGNAVIYDSDIVDMNIVVVDDRAVVVGVVESWASHNMAVEIWITEVSKRDKGEITGSKTKAESDSHPAVPIEETSTRSVNGQRWQRSPSAIGVPSSE